MRDIKYIVLHCTATPQNTSVQSILDYWKAAPPKGNGWKMPGYHHIIKANGEIVNLLPIEQVSNGVKGYNSNSIHISYVGGIDAKGNALDNRTDAQKVSQIQLLKKYSHQFPHAKILGHRDFLTPGKPGYKSCPSFDVRSWVQSIIL